MVVAIEDLATVTLTDSHGNYPFVFTEVSQQGSVIVYTGIMGEKASVDYYTNTVTTIEGGLTTSPLYIISISPHSLSSRVYGGIVRLQNEGGIYFAVVFPDWSILDKLEPTLRWRFRYVSFEYPRKGKKGFLLPTVNTSPFAYSFVTNEEREAMEHLCPPEPVARFIPEQFGYEKKELLRYLNKKGERVKHAGELYPLIQSIFERSQGKLDQYMPMKKELIPQEYRDYQLLYHADGLWDW